MSAWRLLFDGPAIPPHAQVGPYKRLQITIDHAVNVANFGLGAMILDQAVWLQHIRPDLRAKVDIQLGFFYFLRRLALLLHLEFVEFGAQHAHGALAVLVLRALVLATGDNAGGNVRDAYRGIGRVHVLAALAAGAIGVDAKVFRLDHDFDRVIDLGRDKHAGE